MANVTVSAVDVTISTESFGGAALPSWKLLGVFQESDGSAFDVSFAQFISTSFKDWDDTTSEPSGADYSSFLESGYDLLGDAKQDKQPVYVHSFMSKTSKTQTPGGFYETPTRASSLYSDTEVSIGPSPYPFTKHTMHTVGDKIYIFNRGPSADAVGEVYVYDILLNSWEIKTTGIGSDLTDHGSVQIGDDIYIAGGHDGGINKTFFNKYTPATDTWTALASTPVAFARAIMSQFGGKIYMCYGNTQGSGNPDERIYEYDVAADTWTLLSSSFGIDSPRGGSAAIADASGVYIVGGQNSGLLYPTTIYKFDFSLVDWVFSGESITSGREDMAFDQVGNKLYIHGRANPSLDDLFMVYTPGSGVTTPVGAAKAGGMGDHAMAEHNGRFYILGGVQGPTDFYRYKA